MHCRDNRFRWPRNGISLPMLRSCRDMTMRTRVSRFAHVLERTGLAMAGAACGLFVAAHVGSSIAIFTSLGFIFVMMIAGAVGFYLGIDTPPAPYHVPEGAKLMPIDS